ncbi:MAG: ubiquinol-cytochrome c reductase iron-sulfur subunit [Thermoguttaceae bacterium]
MATNPNIKKADLPNMKFGEGKEPLKSNSVDFVEPNLESTTESAGCGCNVTGRRSFCKTVVAAGIAGAAVAIPIAASTRLALTSTEQKGNSGKFYPIGSLDSIDKTPKKFAIVDDVKDAWQVSPNQKIGAIFVHKNDKDEVVAFQTVCPHAGCKVDVAMKINPTTPDAKEEEMLFFCPCHAAYFDLNGARLVKPGESSPSPRDLDSLEVKVEDGMVFIKFEHFITGPAEKTVKS